MSPDETIELRLKPALRECEQHLACLRYAETPSATDWLMLRDLRNSAMHEYPDQPAINAANLNRIYDNIKRLEHVLTQAKTFARERFLNRPG